MLDIFIIIVIVWAVFSGWRNGLVKEIASFGGYLFGLFIAASCYSTFGEYLAVNGSQGNMITSIIAFFILWVVSPIALGLAANVFTKVLKSLHLGGINSIAGAIVSFVKFTLLLSCILNVMSALRILNQERAESSVLYEPVRGMLSSVIDWVMDDSVTPMEHADRPATATGDTVWIDVPHKK